MDNVSLRDLCHISETATVKKSAAVPGDRPSWWMKTISLGCFITNEQTDDMVTVYTPLFEKHPEIAAVAYHIYPSGLVNP